jgi:hypothetical protein
MLAGDVRRSTHAREHRRTCGGRTETHTHIQRSVADFILAIKNYITISNFYNYLDFNCENNDCVT